MTYNPLISVALLICFSIAFYYTKSLYKDACKIPESEVHTNKESMGIFFLFMYVALPCSFITATLFALSFIPLFVKM